jgi:hypothetical protein
VGELLCLSLDFLQVRSVLLACILNFVKIYETWRKSVWRIVTTDVAFYLARFVHCELINKLFQYQNMHSWTVMYFSLNLLKPTGHAMHQQFNIKQLYALPTLYLCVV